jgi:hypothetical protein
MSRFKPVVLLLGVVLLEQALGLLDQVIIWAVSQQFHALTMALSHEMAPHGSAPT